MRAALDGTAFALRESFHPHWRVSVGDDVAKPLLSMDEDSGFIVVSELQAGHYSVDLRYVAPRWPARLSVVAWALWFGAVVGIWAWRRLDK